ncbi:MAG: hypothetical protein HND47_07345 [Chloroflexi bacterium]|nr:hypothetical protein [Chloroflexota bacterium]
MVQPFDIRLGVGLGHARHRVVFGILLEGKAGPIAREAVPDIQDEIMVIGIGHRVFGDLECRQRNDVLRLFCNEEIVVSPFISPVRLPYLQLHDVLIARAHQEFARRDFDHDGGFYRVGRTGSDLPSFSVQFRVGAYHPAPDHFA